MGLEKPTLQDEVHGRPLPKHAAQDMGIAGIYFTVKLTGIQFTDGTAAESGIPVPEEIFRWLGILAP